MLNDIGLKILSYQNIEFTILCGECGCKVIVNEKETGRKVKYCNTCRLIVISRQKKQSKQRNAYNKLGTTELGSNFCGDFIRERQIINRELIRLGLRKRNYE